MPQQSTKQKNLEDGLPTRRVGPTWVQLFFGALQTHINTCLSVPERNP